MCGNNCLLCTMPFVMYVTPGAIRATLKLEEDFSKKGRAERQKPPGSLLVQLSCWISQPPDFLVCTMWKLLIFKSFSAGLSSLQLKANSWILLPNSGLLCKSVLFGMWKYYGALKMRASITVITYFSFLQITST